LEKHVLEQIPLTPAFVRIKTINTHAFVRTKTVLRNFPEQMLSNLMLIV
jgi:hypothetical protein